MSIKKEKPLESLEPPHGKRIQQIIPMRIQTAEGWKRGQVRKHKTSKIPLKS